MHSFPELIKKIRKEANLTQAEFAKILGISTILITMIETGQKEVSKKTLIKIAQRLEVNPSSITPFLFNTKKNKNNLSIIEQNFLKWGEKLQTYLINDRAKLLKKYAN
jgi:transcriptional regulator with XRE-family HTH domain